MYPCSRRIRASSVLNFDAGMSTNSKSASSPLRMRVRKSATGSVIDIARLPARLGQSGNVALVRHLAQADPAQAELAEVGTGAAAPLAAVVAPRLVLRRAPLAHNLGSLCH